MTSLITLVQTTTYDMSPTATRLPSPLWAAFSVLNRVHGVWRWFRRIKLYSDPENLAQLLAGHAVNLVFGDVLLLRIAAQCLLVSTRILECVQQQTALCRSGRRFISAIKGHYPHPVQSDWNTDSVNTWKSPFSSLGYRIERIARCAFNLLKHTLLLSMCIMDAIDAFCLSQHTQNDGINEGFVNATKWLNTIVDNKEELLQGIIDNQAIIERILAKSPFTFIQLREGVENALDKTEFIATKTRDISNVSNGIIIDIAKRMIINTMTRIGLADYRPSFLAVEATPKEIKV